jgi:hypothetical protein
VKNGTWDPGSWCRCRIGFGAESKEGPVSGARSDNFSASTGDMHFPDLTAR